MEASEEFHLMRTSHDRSPQRQPKRLGLVGRLGLFSVAVFLAGTLVIAATVAFLGFLWGSASETVAWLRIVLAGWVPRAVTLSSLLVRSIATAQAAICTSILAALALSHFNILLRDSVAATLMQVENTGPYSLAILLLRSLRHGKGLRIGALVLILALSNGLLQFTSTILLSDVTIGIVTNFEQQRTTPYGLSRDGIDRYYEFDNDGYHYKKPSAYPTFAEYSEKYETSDGVHDTGKTMRAYLPISSEPEREFLKSYSGMATVVDSRVVCMRPVIADAKLHFDGNGVFSPYLSGSVATNLTAPRVIVPFGDDQPLKPFNCSTAYTGYGSTVEWPLVVCTVSQNRGIVSDMQRIEDVESLGEADYLMNGPSVPYLILNATGSYEQWDGYDFNESLSIASAESYEYHGEWLRIPTTDPEINISLSICFTAFMVLDLPVNVSSAANHTEPTIGLDTATGQYDTRAIRHQLGAADAPATLESRGIYSLEPRPWAKPWDWDQNQETLPFLYMEYARAGLEQPDGGGDYIYNFSMVLCLLCVSPDNETTFRMIETTQAAIFNDIVRKTGHPALGLQARYTTLFGMVYYDHVALFDYSAPTKTFNFVQALTPTAWRGFVIMIATLALHFLTIAVAVSFFASDGSQSLVGSAWAAVAQLRGGVIEEWIARAGSVRDRAIVTEMQRSGVGARWTGLNRGADHLELRDRG